MEYYIKFTQYWVNRLSMKRKRGMRAAESMLSVALQCLFNELRLTFISKRYVVTRVIQGDGGPI